MPAKGKEDKKNKNQYGGRLIPFASLEHRAPTKDSEPSSSMMSPSLETVTENHKSAFGKMAGTSRVAMIH